MALSQLWQYQQKAEPVFPPVAAVVPEQWHPEYPHRLDPTPHPILAPTLPQPFVESQSTDTRVWRPVAPDWIDAVPSLSGAVRATTVTTFISADVLPLDASARAWSPWYPDAIDRRVLPTAHVPFNTQALSPTFPVPDLSWRSVFQDAIDRRQIPTAAIPTGPSALSPAFPVPALSWRAVYQDWIDRRSLAPAAMPTGTSALSPAFPVPPLAWRSITDDWIARRQPPPWMPVWAGPIEPVVVAGAPELSWAGLYPPYLFRRVLSTAAQQVMAFWPLPIPPAPAPALSWAGIFPAWIARRQTHPRFMPSLNMGTGVPPAVVGMVTFSFPDEVFGKHGLHPSRALSLAWSAESSLLPPAPVTARAVYPDRFVYRQPPPASGATVPPSLFPTVVPLFGWPGWQPTQLDRLRLWPSQHLATVLGMQAMQPVLLEWWAHYPDSLLPPSRVAWDLTAGMNQDPIPNPPSPELAWGPCYPDHLWPLVTLHPAWQQFWASDRIRPVSPDLAWRPIAPDHLWHVMLGTARMPTLSFTERVIQPDLRLDWLAGGPDPVRRPPPRLEGVARPVEVPVSPVVWLADRQDPPDAPMRRSFLIQGGTAPPGALIVIAERIAWHIDLPVPLRRPSLVSWMPAGPSSLVTIDDAWCIMFGDDAGVGPLLDGEDLLLPTFDAEVVIAPMFTNEEVC